MNDTIFKDYASISFIGMGKNVGKTTALNYFIGKANGNYSLGLTSVGLDGESIDKVTDTSKPRIYVSAGTLIATAQGCFPACDTTKEILAVTPISTPLGAVIVFRCLSDGYVEIAGPSTKMGLTQVVELLLSKGAQKVFVDGALSRKSLASPSVTDATVFSTGAAVSNNVRSLAEKTVHQYQLLSMPMLEEELLRRLLLEKTEDRMIRIDHDYQVQAFDVKTALGADEKQFSSLQENTRLLYIQGALTDKLAGKIIENTPIENDFDLVIEDGSKAFLEKDTVTKLQLKGIRLKAMEKITVVAVTVNPYSPAGFTIDAQKLKEALEKQLPVPVCNIKEVQRHEISR